MGQKNKGRPKRQSDRPFRPLGDRDPGRPQHKQARGGDQRRERGGAQTGDASHSEGFRGKPRGEGFRGEPARGEKPRGERFRGAHPHARSDDRERGEPRPSEGKRDGVKRERAPFPPRHGSKPDRETGDGAGRRGRRFEPRSAPREKHGEAAEPRPDKRDGKPQREERLWIYGRHAAIAAIANPARKIKRILVTDGALEWISELRVPRERLESLMKVAPAHIDSALHPGAVHQGIAVEVEDLPRARLKEDCAPDGMRPVVVLDQITDPHNIGAIIRSAAAFNARAIVVQDRRTPPLAGALAKAAAGAVELVPCVAAVNIARSLEGLKALGYHCAALEGGSGAAISSLPKDMPVAIVLGAEGAGLRKLVRETCDGVYAIPIARSVDSLNVSNAAAVALYEATRR